MRRVIMIDFNANPPTQHRLDAMPVPTIPRLSPDGKRLYLGSQYSHLRLARSWDVEEAKSNHRVRELGEFKWTQFKHDPVNPDTYQPFKGPFLSPDGTCALFGNGEAFWLTGAGPLPDVDPAAKP